MRRGLLILATLVALRFLLWHPGSVEGVTQLDLAIVFLTDTVSLRWGHVHLSASAPPTFPFIKDVLVRIFAYTVVMILSAVAFGSWLGAHGQGSKPSRFDSIALTVAAGIASVPVFCLFYLLLYPAWVASYQPWFPDWLEFTLDQTGRVTAFFALALSGVGATLWHARVLPTAVKGTTVLRFLQMRLGELVTWVLAIEALVGDGFGVGNSFSTMFLILWARDLDDPLIWIAFAIAFGIACLYTMIGVALALIGEDPDAAGLIPPPATPPKPP